MKFLVRFSGLVMYQPDHPLRRRMINGLCVSAPTADGAMQHALRTTRGEATVLEVVPADEALPAALDAAMGLLPYLPAPEVGETILGPAAGISVVPRA